MNAVSDDELRRALAPFRPDRARFKSELERKLAERRPQENAHWTAAAAVFPFEVFGAWPGAVAPKATSGVATVLAMPVISLAMLALACARAVRAVARLGVRSEATPADLDRALRAWWRRHAWAAGFVLLGLISLARSQPLDAVVLVLLVSMFALASVLEALSRAGAASRANVGIFTASLLGGVAALVIGIGSATPSGASESWKDPWIPFVLLAGCVLCDRIGSWRRAQSRGLWLALSLLPVALLGALGMRLGERGGIVDRDSTVAFVERFDAPLSDLVGWMRFGVLAERLREDGVAFEARPARAIVDAALADAGTPPNPRAVEAPTYSLLAAARAGLLPREAWSGVLADAEIQGILAGEGPLLEAASTEWLVRAAVAASLPDAVRTRLAARTTAALPEPGSLRALEALDHAAQMCALLGHPLAGPEAAERARAAVTLRWRARPGTDGVNGGFAPDTMPPDLAARGVHQVDPTLAAVRLMRRFGVPSDVDLDVLEEYLRAMATPSLVETLAPEAFALLTIQSYRYVARIALDELATLRATAGVPRAERSPVGRVADARHLSGALALVALCIATLARTARANVATASRPGLPLL